MIDFTKSTQKNKVVHKNEGEGLHFRRRGWGNEWGWELFILTTTEISIVLIYLDAVVVVDGNGRAFYHSPNIRAENSKIMNSDVTGCSAQQAEAKHVLWLLENKWGFIHSNFYGYNAMCTQVEGRGGGGVGWFKVKVTWRGRNYEMSMRKWKSRHFKLEVLHIRWKTSTCTWRKEGKETTSISDTHIKTIHQQKIVLNMKS